VPSYALVVRETMPPSEAATRVGIVIGISVAGMAFGGWVSGLIFDATGSYRAAFLNGVAWNALNMGIVLLLLLRARSRPAFACRPGGPLFGPESARKLQNCVSGPAVRELIPSVPLVCWGLFDRRAR
jgi:MFS family permease